MQSDHPIAARGPPSSAAAISFPSILFPAFAILSAISSLALPIFLGQYVLGLILACLGLVGGIVGLILLLIKKWQGIPTHLAALAIGVAGVLLAVNVLMLRASIERNEDLRTKNEQTALKAKADLDEATRKAVDAEEAFRKTDEAPKKAEAFYALAKDTQDKATAAEKRTADLLAQIENLERKNDLDRKKIADDKVKVELSEKNLKALQKNLDQTIRDIEGKRQELVTLKKEIEADKKTAAAERTKAEEKQKETKGLLNKIEAILKGAALNLKDKNPDVRIKTANGLAKLPAFLEAKETVGEALVETMFDPIPDVRNAASVALEKIDPAVHPHVLTLAIGQDKHGAVVALEKLGKGAKSALPALIHCHNVGLGKQIFLNPYALLQSLTKIAPEDKRVGQIILSEIGRANPNQGLYHQGRETAIQLLDRVAVDRPDKIKVLLAALNDGELTVAVIGAIEKIKPAAVEAVPVLTKLKLSPDDAVRRAAMKALTKIEAGK